MPWPEARLLWAGSFLKRPGGCEALRTFFWTSSATRRWPTVYWIGLLNSAGTTLWFWLRLVWISSSWMTTWGCPPP